MKLSTLSIITHSMAGAIGVLAGYFCSVQSHSLLSFAAIGIAVALIIPVASVGTKRINKGISSLEQAVSGGNESYLIKSNLQELDHALEHVRVYAQRWSAAAERSRLKSQELDWLSARLEHCKAQSGASVSVSQLLGSFANSVDSGFEKIDELLNEFQNSFKLQSNSLEDQSEAVSKATNFVEQLSANVAQLPESLSLAKDDSSSVVTIASSVSEQAEALTNGIKGFHEVIDSNEIRIRALLDSFREIGSIAESISEISGRTDMLALNVSLEAVRAGENARGFTVLSEEVRKLSEQTAKAAHEVSGIVESIQFKTHETLKGISEQQTQIGSAVKQCAKVLQSISDIRETSSQAGSRLSGLSNATGQQLKLAHELLDSFERLTEKARDGRRKLESTSWGLGNLLTTSEKMRLLFQPLRESIITHQNDENCSGTTEPEMIEEMAGV